MATDYESLPGSLGGTPKRPLLYRSVSSRAMAAGPQAESPNRQKKNPPEYQYPNALFSLHTTPPSARPLPLPPSPKPSKFLGRSLTFSSSKLKPSLQVEEEEEEKVQPKPAEGPATFVKSLFRSSTFKGDAGNENAGKPSFLRSSSFAHKEQGFSIAKSLSRSFSSLSESEEGSFSKWFRSKPSSEQQVVVPESSPYSLFSSPSSSSRVFPIEELESSFRGLLDSSKNAVKAVHEKARELVSSQNQSQRFNQVHYRHRIPDHQP